MAEEYSHINYSIADIERYLNGRMTAKEMHDMERAALGDPFLADAIEGYREADLDQSYKHLDEISAALLQPEKKETKVIPIAGRRNGWWRVAASVILLGGLGVISWFLLKENNSVPQREIAQEKKSSAAIVDSIKVEDKKESPAIAQNVVPKEHQSDHPVPAKKEKASRNKQKSGLQEKAEEESVKPVIEDKIAASEQKAANLRIKEDSVVTASLARDEQRRGLSAQAPPSTQRAFAAPAKTYVFKGKVSDDNHLPVPNATISLENTNVGTVTDMDGNFAIVSHDSTATVSVSSIGYTNTNVQLKQNINNAITISDNAQSLNETVVVGYGSKKAKKSDSLASPVVGWESFDQYVAERMKKKYDSTASLSDLNGDVMIEFLVDNKGKPYNFKVLKSLSEDADKKAVDIIKGGPAWTRDGKRKKGKVTIHF